MEEDFAENNLGVEDLQLIDISSQDDFLIDSSMGDSSDDLRLSVHFTGVLENKDKHDGFKQLGIVDSGETKNSDSIMQRERFLLSESTQSGRASDLRKSLAWDSAFFTSAGVLDSEELFIMNQGFEKTGAHLLPVIEEDLCNWRSSDLLSTLDTDTFSLESNESSEINLFEDVRASIYRSSTMSNVFKSGCKSGGGEARKQRIHSQRNLDSQNEHQVKTMPAGKQNSWRTQEVGFRSQIAQHGGRNKESSSFPMKLPKILGRMKPVSARQSKAVSLATGLANKSSLEKYCSISSMTSSKSSSSVSITATSDSAVSSLHTHAPSFKSSSNLKRKTDSGNNQTSRTPLMCSQGCNRSLENETLLTPVLYMPKNSYQSPASSTDGWSFVSSSTSTNQSSGISDASIDNGTPTRACLGNEATYRSFDHNNNQQKRLENENQWIHAVRGTGNVFAKSTKSKPSGLRMPSPKIGFFDEEKFMISTGSGGLQFHCGAKSVFPEKEGITNRKRPVKPKSARVLPKNEDAKPSPKMSNTTVLMRKFTGKASKDHVSISPQFRESCSKSRKVESEHDTRKLDQHSSSTAERKRKQGAVKKETCRESRIHPGKNVPLVHNEGITPSKKEDKRTSDHENEKENLHSFEDHVNNLSRFFEIIDLEKDVKLEIRRKRGCSHPKLGDNFSENGSPAMISYSSAGSKSKPGLTTRTPLAEKILPNREQKRWNL
ncbi:hypothetical protein NMG60_11018598 [Bertholletia excelsa]